MFLKLNLNPTNIGKQSSTAALSWAALLAQGGKKNSGDIPARAPPSRLVVTEIKPNPTAVADLAAANGAFQPSPTFSGVRPGFVFKAGPLGSGYYEDKTAATAAVAALAPGASAQVPKAGLLKSRILGGALAGTSASAAPADDVDADIEWIKPTSGAGPSLWNEVGLTRTFRACAGGGAQRQTRARPSTFLCPISFLCPSLFCYLLCSALSHSLGFRDAFACN